MTEHFLVRDAISERNWLIQQQEQINYQIEMLTQNFHELGSRIDVLDNLIEIYREVPVRTAPESDEEALAEGQVSSSEDNSEELARAELKVVGD